MYAASSRQPAVPPPCSYWKKEWCFLSSRPQEPSQSPRPFKGGQEWSCNGTNHCIVSLDNPMQTNLLTSAPLLLLWDLPLCSHSLHSRMLKGFVAAEIGEFLLSMIPMHSQAKSKENCCYFFNRPGLPPKAKLLILILNTTATFPAYLMFDSGQGLCAEKWRRQK